MWVGRAISEVTRPIGLEQLGQRIKNIKKVKFDRPSDRPTDQRTDGWMDGQSGL